MRLSLLFLAASLLQAQSPAQAEKANRAKSLLGENKFAEAAALYTDLVKSIPNNPGLLLNQGMALHMAGEDAKAIPPLESALRLNPSIPPAMLFLGASYLRTGQPAKAMVLLEKFVSIDPNHAEARQMLVDAATASGQPHRAVPHLEKLSQLDPRQPAVWYELGRNYEGLAAEAFGQLEKGFPESGPFFAVLANSRSKISQSKAAFFFYRKALAQSPNLRGLRSSLAAIYRQNDHPEWALHEEAAEAKLPKLNCAVKTPECEFNAGRYQSAIRLSRVRNTAENLYWRVQCFNVLAADAFAKLNALPESPESARLLAETQRELGRHAEAATAWQNALRLAPGNPEFERELAAAWMNAKQYIEAQKLTDTLLAREPNAPDLNHLQGDLFLAQQLAEQAIPFLEKAVKADPLLLPAQASLARALLQAGRAAEALPHVTAALPIDTDGSLHFQLARAYQSSGQAEAAKTAMAKYQEIRTRSRKQDQFLEEELKISPPQ